MVIINKDIFKFFDTDKVSDYIYSPNYGINKYSTVPYCENIHKQTELFFKLCDLYKLEYVVFAGSSVGLVRNKEMMPWTDDFDIIVMEQHKEFFFTELMPIFKLYGFKFWGCGTETGSKSPGWTFIGGSPFNKVEMRVDIFWSKINSKGIVENVDKKGFYHNKVPKEAFFPVKKQHFHGLYIPFGNDYEKEVLLTYGDVRKECVIKTHKKDMKQITIKYDRWEDGIKDFDYLKQLAIQNMKDYIQIEKYKPTEDKKLQLDYVDYNTIFNIDKEFLKYIVDNNIDTINTFVFWKFKHISALVKFYFPTIKINLFINSLEEIDYFYLNYATTIYTYNDNVKQSLDSLIYVSKPKIKVAKIITFGTFDLFHQGHKNIIDTCKKLSEKLVIGVSNDKLNEKKGKKSHENIDTRITNVKTYSNSNDIFEEESLEQKLDYIKQHECNILVMGNDWENKFNSNNYECVYLQRTPGISSTMLRDELKNNK